MTRSTCLVLTHLIEVLLNKQNTNDHDDDDNNKNVCVQTVQTLSRHLQCRRLVSEHILRKMPYLLEPLQCRPLVSDNISYKMPIS